MEEVEEVAEEGGGEEEGGREGAEEVAGQEGGAEERSLDCRLSRPRPGAALLLTGWREARPGGGASWAAAEGGRGRRGSLRRPGWARGRAGRRRRGSGRWARCGRRSPSGGHCGTGGGLSRPCGGHLPGA